MRIKSEETRRGLLKTREVLKNTSHLSEALTGFTLPFSFKTPYVFNQIFPISQNFPINIISISIYILNTFIGFIGTIFGIILIRRRQLMREGVVTSFSSVGLSLFTGFLSGLALSLAASLMLIWIIKYDIPRDSYKS